MLASGDFNTEFIAQVVELVDTLASGASDRKVVEVQVLFWAPIYSPSQVIPVVLTL
jgi:hypothetical protein